MDSFTIGQEIENFRLPKPIKGIVKCEKPIVKNIGNRTVRMVLVQIDEFEVGWLLENVRPIAKPVVNLTIPTLVVPEPMPSLMATV